MVFLFWNTDIVCIKCSDLIMFRTQNLVSLNLTLTFKHILLWRQSFLLYRIYNFLYFLSLYHAYYLSLCDLLRTYKEPVNTFILESILILVHSVTKAAKLVVMNKSITYWIKIEGGNSSKWKNLICPTQGWLYSQRKRSLSNIWIGRDVLNNSLIVLFDITCLLWIILW